MFQLFNVILIALALLIAYWWANQGLFSAILHFLCVLVAGSLAFATWEPIAMLMLNRGLLENYAWGISLLAPFAIYLLICRVVADKSVGDNLNLPTWANYVFGGIVGLGSGILTVGMCMIGSGFVQCTMDIMEFSGAYRSTSNRGQPDFTSERAWIPMHEITATTFNFLSVRALRPEFGRPLQNVYPKIAETAFSLHRDSHGGGRARTALAPADVTLGRLWYSPDFANTTGPMGAYLLELELDRGASDPGGILTVTASQIRLIENVDPSETREPGVSYPDRWSQKNDSGTTYQVWPFDDVLNVASNVPGQEKTKFLFAFPAANLGTPDHPPIFAQIKGLRLRLPVLEKEPLTNQQMLAVMRNPASAAGQLVKGPPVIDITIKTIAARDLTIDPSTEPAHPSVNELANLEQTDQLLTTGHQEFVRGGPTPSKANRINGIYAREGTAIVRLNISRKISSIDIWGDKSDLRSKAGETATLMLIDSEGNQYTPIGYIWVRSEDVEIHLDPKRGIQAVEDFPKLPSSGTHDLYAIFNPTAGVKIVLVQLGSQTVANAELQIPGAVPAKK